MNIDFLVGVSWTISVEVLIYIVVTQVFMQ